jgi:hypothetical protein
MANGSVFAQIGIVPQRLTSIFDLKLFGGKAHEFLNSLLVHVIFHINLKMVLM